MPEAAAARRTAWGGLPPWALEYQQYFPGGAAARVAQQRAAVEARIKAEGLDVNSFEAERMRRQVGTEPVNMGSIRTLRGPTIAAGSDEGSRGMAYIREPGQVAQAARNRENYDTWLNDRTAARSAAYRAMSEGGVELLKAGQTEPFREVMGELLGGGKEVQEVTPKKVNLKDVAPARENVANMTLGLDPVTGGSVEKGTDFIKLVDAAVRSKEPYEMQMVAEKLSDYIESDMIGDKEQKDLRIVMDKLKPLLGANVDTLEKNVLYDFFTKSTEELKVQIPTKRSTVRSPSPLMRAMTGATGIPDQQSTRPQFQGFPMLPGYH
jgi:hypothetical protein